MVAVNKFNYEGHHLVMIRSLIMHSVALLFVFVSWDLLQNE